jgi:hypothetical protein
VSTLDGRLSALDPSDGGSVSWSTETGPGQMLSSSIHRLEVTSLCKIYTPFVSLMMLYHVSILNKAVFRMEYIGLEKRVCLNRAVTETAQK